MPWWSRELFVQGRSPGDGLEADWREVRPEDGNFNARLPRFYLFALKAYAYLQMSSGRLAGCGKRALL